MSASSLALTRASIAHRSMSSTRARRCAPTRNTVASSASSSASDLEAMRGVSVCVVGDNERANDGVARALAKRFGYACVSVPALVESAASAVSDEDEDDESAAATPEAKRLMLENSAHEQLSTYLRLCVATSGGGRGATARGDCWTWLFGMITVWVDEEGADETAPQREAYELSEVRVVVSKGKDDYESVADRVMDGIKTLLDADAEICGRKNLYIRFGCRGDWPNLQPPGEWKGELEGGDAGGENGAT